jgi:type I restriction enzyme, S subunit
MSPKPKERGLSSQLNEWRNCTLGEIASGFVSGGTPSTRNEALWKGDVPWITSKWIKSPLFLSTGEKFISLDAVRCSATSIVPKNSLIFATRVGVGKVAINSLDLAINQDLAGISVDGEQYDLRFLAYQLRSERIQKEIASHKRGATIQGITRDNLKGLALELPPLPEQQKIADVLGVVQRAMEQQERLLALTAELKKTLLHQLFTQGLCHEPQKQTDIGPVPESWEVVKVGVAAKIQSGGTPARDTSENWEGGTIPWVKTGEIDYCVIRDTEEKITPAGLASSAARLFPAGTLLMAMYGQGVTRGRVALLGIDATTNQACASITPHDEAKVSSRFLYHWFEYHYENLRKLGHGANQRNMNAALIRGFPLAYPPPSEQAQIVSSLSALDAKRDHHQSKHATLTALFRTLLHQLMTAQIRVDQLVPLGAATGSE